jgi:hypothetical protein
MLGLKITVITQFVAGAAVRARATALVCSGILLPLPRPDRRPLFKLVGSQFICLTGGQHCVQKWIAAVHFSFIAGI